MGLIEEDCSLCGVTYPYYSLYRCSRCRRLYCRNCFLYDEERKIICLRCAKKRVFPGGPRSKYAYLSTYLARRAKYGPQATLSFSRIEEIIGDRLPSSAYSNRQWWGNSWNRSSSEAWLTVGWKVVDVDLDRNEVTFRKQKQTAVAAPKRRRRRKPVSQAFKALALKRRPRKPSRPSKTKVSIAQARLKNIERRKTYLREYRGRLKPRRAYEKRLYKPEEKPD
jgi:hypothetical protein